MKIITGKNHNLWQISKKNNGLNEQMQPFVCKEFVGRSTNKFDNHNTGGWDCDNGIYIYGKKEKVKKVYQKLYSLMVKKLNEKIVENDLGEEDSPHYLAMYISKKENIAVIIGGGYYETNEDKLWNVLDTCEGVITGDLGANYTDDKDFFNTLIEIVHYNLKEKAKTKALNLKILKEVFIYWKKSGIQNKTERKENGYKNVDKAVKNFV